MHACMAGVPTSKKMFGMYTGIRSGISCHAIVDKPNPANPTAVEGALTNAT